jgi:hypothetical protein
MPFMRSAAKPAAPRETVAKSATIRVILIVIERFSIFIQFSIMASSFARFAATKMHRARLIKGLHLGVPPAVLRFYTVRNPIFGVILAGRGGLLPTSVAPIGLGPRPAFKNPQPVQCRITNRCTPASSSRRRPAIRPGGPSIE